MCAERSAATSGVASDMQDVKNKIAATENKIANTKMAIQATNDKGGTCGINQSNVISLRTRYAKCTTNSTRNTTDTPTSATNTFV